MDIKSFKQFSEDTKKDVVFTFGRYNPPTVGHEKLFDKVASVAKQNKASYRIYASQSSDPKKNPLDSNTKVKVLRKMFPKHARSIMANKGIKTAMNAASALHDQGFTSATMVVGDDRVQEFKTLLNKYNGAEGRHGYYNFKDGINVVSAGARDPDAEGVEGMSASKMRKAAADNDFSNFKLGLPKGYKDGQKLFNDIRSAMGLKESLNFRQHIQLEEVSKEREEYVKGNLFSVNDEVVVKETNELGVVEELGANFVTVKLDKETKRFWLKQIIRAEDYE